MPTKKIDFKKVALGTLIVGAPIGATLGIVYGTETKTAERQELPAVTFGDKYFDSVIKTDRAYAPSHVFSPNGGFNLYSSYTDLIANNDTEHYMKLIKQKSDGSGSESPIFIENIDVSDIKSVEDLESKFIDVNNQLHDIASSKDASDDTATTGAVQPASERSLGLLTIPTIKDSKRVIEVIAYELKSDKDLTEKGDEFINKFLDFDFNNYSASLTKFENLIQKQDGYDWTKDFLQIVLSKTSASNDMFKRFGIKNVQQGDDAIKAYGLKYKIDPKKGKVPVEFTDTKGVKHYVLTPRSWNGKESKFTNIHSAGDLVDGKLESDEYPFDGQIRNSNGDFDYESTLYENKSMVEAGIVPQLEASLDWRQNSWYIKLTFNRVNHDSIITLTQSLDSVRNSESVSTRTINIPLENVGKPQSAEKIKDSKITAENLAKFDADYKARLASKTSDPDDVIDGYEKNSMLRQAVSTAIQNINTGTDEEKQEKLYDIIRNAFLGKPGSHMLPQFSHFLKRNLVSDGLNIIGKFMPGILGPIDSFKSLIDMIDQQKTSLVKHVSDEDGKEYFGDEFLRKVIFSDKNIENIFAELDKADGSTNGISFIYHSIIQFGITEQRTAGILSKGSVNENGEPYIIKSSDDWMWSSVTKLSSLSAERRKGDFSLYNLYELFAGLNGVDDILIKSMEQYEIKKPSTVDDGDSIISQLFGWANSNKVLPAGYNLQNVIADVPGTIKKLIGNLYKNNVLAREDEAKGLPTKQRHNFVAFPSTLIEKLISLIPGVDWAQIKEDESNKYKTNFDKFITVASTRENIGKVTGDSLKELATEEWNALKEANPSVADNFKLPSTEFNSFNNEAAQDKLRNFVMDFASRGYLDKISLEHSFKIAQIEKDFFRQADSSVLRGFVIPNKLPEINPQEDVRKSAVSILGDPYTLISLIDSIKGDEDIDKFLDNLLPTNTIDIQTMIPVLLESLTTRHNLDIMSIDKILNIVSRMNLLPSIVDKILTPSVVSTLSDLIQSGKAEEMYDALKILYSKGLFTYLKDDAGKTEFETDLEPIAAAFAEKLKLITQEQKDKLSATDQKSAVTVKQFLDAIYDILQHGIGDSTNNISASIKLLGNVITNSLELPDTMINVPKLVEALTDIFENKSVKQVLQESISNTNKDSPTPFVYLFDMLHKDGSSIIYDMLPIQLQHAMDTYPTADLMSIFNNLINGFKTESQFQQFLDFIKGLLPRDKDGKTLFDMKISELDESVPSIVDLAVPKVEQVLLKAYRNEDIANVLFAHYGKAEISTPLSEMLKEGILSHPDDVATKINALLHTKIKMAFGLYTLDIWKMLPDNIKDMMTKVLSGLSDTLNVVDEALSNPINQLKATDVEKIINIVKIFIPNLKVSDSLVNGIFFVLHNGLNVGANGPTPIDALKEVNNLFGIVQSFTTIPESIKSVLMNVFVGKQTFETYSNNLVDEMEKEVANNLFTKMNSLTGDFASVKANVDKYNSIVDSIETYKSMVSDKPSLLKTDVQDLVVYKTKLDELISDANTIKQSIEDVRLEKTGLETTIDGLKADIDKIKSISFINILEKYPDMLAMTYKSLDGKQHKYSEFNSLESGLRKSLLDKAKTIISTDFLSIDDMKQAEKDLSNINSEVTRVDALSTTFNDGVKRSDQIFSDYQTWMKDTKIDGGSYIAPHKTDSSYVQMFNILLGKMKALKATAKASNVSLVENHIKEAYKAFNAQLSSDMALATDAEAINSIFAELDRDDLKALISGAGTSIDKLITALTDSNLQALIDGLDASSKATMYSKISSSSMSKMSKFMKVSDKVTGIDGLASSITDALKGKTLDWVLDNVRVGRKSGFWQTTWLSFDFFGQNTGASGDGDIKKTSFASLRTWTSDGKNIESMDGSSSWSAYWKNTLIIHNGDNGSHYSKLSDSHHEIVTFLQHVYSKDYKWLASNGWI